MAKTDHFIESNSVFEISQFNYYSDAGLRVLNRAFYHFASALLILLFLPVVILIQLISASCEIRPMIRRLLKKACIGLAKAPSGSASLSRPQMIFAGIWTEWEGDRGTKAAPDVGKHLVFSFLTTDASPDVVPIHPNAKPVLLLDNGAR